MNGRGNKRANTFDEIIITKRLKVADDVVVEDDGGNISGGGGGGATIDDGGTSTSVVFSASKIIGDLATKSNTGHTHVIGDVTNLQTSLDTKAPLANPTFTGTVTATSIDSGGATTDLTIGADTGEIKFNTGVGTLSDEVDIGISGVRQVCVERVTAHPSGDVIVANDGFYGTNPYSYLWVKNGGDTILNAAGTLSLAGTAVQVTGALTQGGTQVSLEGHAHAISDVTNLQTSLDGKAATSHTHVIGDVTNLQTSLDAKAATSHTHAIGDVTNLQTSLDAKAPTSSPTFTGTVTATSIDSGGATTDLTIGADTGEIKFNTGVGTLSDEVDLGISGVRQVCVERVTAHPLGDVIVGNDGFYGANPYSYLWVKNGGETILNSAGTLSLQGTEIKMTGALTGVADFELPDNTASALSIDEGGNNYMRIDTTDGAETVVVNGRDVKADGVALDAHVADTNDPHGTLVDAKLSGNIRLDISSVTDTGVIIPKITDSPNTFGTLEARSIISFQTYMFVSCRQGRYEMWDIADGTNPIRLKVLQVGSAVNIENFAESLSVSYPYLGAAGRIEGIILFDISVPADFKVVGTFVTPSNDGQGILIEPPYLYCVTDKNKVDIFNLCSTVPERLTIASLVTSRATAHAGGTPLFTYDSVDGNKYLNICSNRDATEKGKILAININVPAFPTEYGFVLLTGAEDLSTRFAWVFEVSLVNNYLYWTSPIGGDPRVYRSNLTNYPASTSFITKSSIQRNIRSNGSFVFGCSNAGGTDKVTIFDPNTLATLAVSPPSDPNTNLDITASGTDVYTISQTDYKLHQYSLGGLIGSGADLGALKSFKFDCTKDAFIGGTLSARRIACGTSVTSGVSLFGGDLLACSDVNIEGDLDVAGTTTLDNLTVTNKLTASDIGVPSGAAVFVSVNNVARLQVDGTTTTSYNPIQGAFGTASAPGYTFQSDADTGIYRPAANEVAVTCNGIERFKVTGTQVESSAVIRATTGLVNNPSYSFIGDTDTGIYQPVAGQVSVTCDGATNTLFDTTGLTIEGTKLFRHGAVIQDTSKNAHCYLGNQISGFPTYITTSVTVPLAPSTPFSFGDNATAVSYGSLNCTPRQTGYAPASEIGSIIINEPGTYEVGYTVSAEPIDDNTTYRFYVTRNNIRIAGTETYQRKLGGRIETVSTDAPILLAINDVIRLRLDATAAKDIEILGWQLHVKKLKVSTT